MTTPRDLERRLAEHFISAAPLRAPDWILPAALTTIESTRQRRGLLAPWRFPTMTQSTKLAAAGIAVIAVGALVLWQLAPPGGGGPPPPTPTPTASRTPAPTSTRGPTVSNYVPPGLTESFTSDLHGLSISYPAGWTVQAATEPWTRPGPILFREAHGDFMYDPARTDHLFLGTASQPLDGTPFVQWSTDFLTAEGCAATGTVVIDGVEGVLAADCHQAFVTTGERGYAFVLYRSGDDVELRAFDWTAWLREFLATVQLRPDDAIDAVPTASP